MKIEVNGREMKVESPLVLSGLLQQLKLPESGLAVLVHGRIIERKDYSSHVLAEGDTIDILHAVGGG